MNFAELSKRGRTLLHRLGAAELAHDNKGGVGGNDGLMSLEN